MKRYFLYFKYDGGPFHGWQLQPNAHTVQAELEQAISTVLQEKITLFAAGRTDTGVHAEMMVAHFNTAFDLDSIDLPFRLNSLLPDSIAVSQYREVKPEAHARFDATRRTYQYFLISEPSPFRQAYAYLFIQELDVGAMNEAAKRLIGTHDFTSFSRTNTQTFTNNCKVDEAYWEWKEGNLVFQISANRFLRNMVRAIVGTLIEIGLGRMEVSAIQSILDSKDRSSAGVSAPAQGLFLSRIEYPEAGFI